MPGAAPSIKARAVFLLVVGGATSVFLSVALSFNYLFSFFEPVSIASRIIGYVVLSGPIPLTAGATLMLVRANPKSGARLLLTGSVILTAWFVIFYTKAFYADAIRTGLQPWEKLLWWILVPAAVAATDMISYKVYKLTGAAGEAR
jgi:hypothetical protein